MVVEYSYFIGQQKYAKEVLERLGFDKSNTVSNPTVLGCKLSRKDVRWTLDHGVLYKRSKGASLTAYSDID